MPSPSSRNHVIGIDASRMAGRARTGTENYSEGLIRALVSEPAPWSWRLYVNGLGDDIELAQTPQVEIRDIPARRLWTHARLSSEMAMHRPTGLFVPSHVIPLVHPPSVVTIHDLGYLHVPEAHPRRQRFMLDATTRWSARVAKHIIVPSRRTRDDLVHHYHVPDERITIIHHGVHPRFHFVSHDPDQGFRERYGLERPYILAVGTIQPRKNLPLLAQSMRSIREDVDLVIAGKRGWMADTVVSELHAAGLGERLRLLDYVPDDDLPLLYHHARMLVQPSRFEGFGLPVLEAMASGTPVLTTRGSSLAEIAGDNALYYDQDNPDNLSEHISLLLDDNSLRSEYKKRGAVWSKQFTWEHAAQKTRQVLQQALIHGE